MIQSLCGFFSCCILSAAGGHIIQTRLLQPQLNWTFFFVRNTKILFSIFTSIHVVVLSHCWMVMFSLQHSFIPACLWLQDHYNSQIWTFLTVQHRAIVVKSWPNVFSQFFPHWSLFNLDSPKIAVCAWHGTSHVCVFYLLQGTSYMLEMIFKI